MNRRSRRIRRLRTATIMLVGVVLVALAIDVSTPAVIAWRPVQIQGLSGHKVEDLVLQEEDGSDVWATQGYSIYLSRGGGAFEKLFTVLPPLGESWGGFSRILRRMFGYQELVELVPLGGGRLVVFTAGDIYRVDLASGTQERVDRLRYFGRDQGRGVLAHGITKDADGRLYYGEYPTKKDFVGDDVRIWRSDDEGRTWQVAYEFPPSATRHVHTVQYDLHDGSVWAGTGDSDSHSRLGYSLNGGASFTWVGSGSQEFRAVSVCFLRDMVTWAMDTTKAVRVLRWHRADHEIERSRSTLPSPGYYTRALDETRCLLALGETSVSLWLVSEQGEPHQILSWTPRRPALGGPHPVVRLARARGESGSFVHVNPLRTLEDEAAIYRFHLSALRGPQTDTR